MRLRPRLFADRRSNPPAGMLSKTKSLLAAGFISLVNVRFLVFRRPFMLAAIVTFITLAFVGALATVPPAVPGCQRNGVLANDRAAAACQGRCLLRASDEQQGLAHELLGLVLVRQLQQERGVLLPEQPHRRLGAVAACNQRSDPHSCGHGHLQPHCTIFTIAESGDERSGGRLADSEPASASCKRLTES
jgi:hypothetical protein